MNRFVILAAVLFVASACVNSEVRVIERVDTSNKTMRVPPGGGLNGLLKDELRNRGWKIFVASGPTVTTGQVGQNTNLETTRTEIARYGLLLNYQRVDLCITGYAMYVYDLSVVDFLKGTEVLTLSGRDCGNWIASKFASALEGGS